MTWNAVFPIVPLVINQSINQFQTNWAYLAATIGQDHFFDTNTPADGTHKFMNMKNQTIDPAIAADSNSLEYVRATAGSTSWPFFRNSLNIFRNVLSIQGTAVLVAGTNILFDFGTVPTDFPIAGTLYVYRASSPQNSLAAPYTWNGVNVTFLDSGPANTRFSTQPGNQITAVVGVLSSIEIEVTVNMTVSWVFTAALIGTPL